MSWSSFIERGPAAQHAVQLYDEVDELAASVRNFLGAGFRSGSPAIVIVTSDHWLRVAPQLEADGWDLSQLQQEGFLTLRDAAETLATITEGSFPSAERFERVVGGLVDDVAAQFPTKTLRLFGEMVDVLWRRGDERGAVALEGLWNDLQTTRRFALLCGYQLDIFDVRVQTDALPHVFRTHTHARPAADPARLGAALDQALAEVVGPMETARIYLDVAEGVPRGNVPRAQAVLGWLSATDRQRAAKVLDRARAHYRQPHAP